MSNCTSIVFCILLLFVGANNQPECRKAISYKADDLAIAQIINFCFRNNIPEDYEVNLNIPVCDDKLCAPVFLKIKWDLAGNYLGFDTIPGHPLTKFDHKPFSEIDYKKLDQILKDKNSILQALAKNDLVDKSVKVKSATVDAVTGATPATIKNAVVEGAVYSSYTLWHWVNGAVGDSLRAFTLKNYSDNIAFKLLSSANFESQLFAMKRFTPEEYILYFDKLLPVVEKSSPLVRAYLIGKLPIPFQDKAKNKRLVNAVATLDNYSKSIFIGKIVSGNELAREFVPLVLSRFAAFDEKQQEKFVAGVQKMAIPELNEQIKEYFGSR